MNRLFSIRSEIELLNCLVRTIASLKVLADAPTSPSDFCLALARTRQSISSISGRITFPQLYLLSIAAAIHGQSKSAKTANLSEINMCRIM